MKRIQILLALALSPCAVPAALMVGSGPLGIPIPDDSNTGVAHSVEVADSFAIESVGVTLSLSVPEGSAGWLGDLYAYLRHDTGMAVLLNRSGRDAANIAGYSDNQNALVTFTDTGSNGDIHNYRLALFGDEAVSLSGPLAGPWQPDGRAADPAGSLTSDSRTAMLGGFNGLDGAGTWTLFVSDLSSGGQFQLDHWSLELNTPSSIPEPPALGLVTCTLLTGWLWIQRRRR